MLFFVAMCIVYRNFSEKKPANTNVYRLSSVILLTLLPPRVGLEPTTTRLTAECSTIELSRIIHIIYSGSCALKTEH